MAIGDMPYNLPGDYAAFERVIARINAARPAFTLHVGDIISGQSRCDDALFSRVRDMFSTFDGALVYTPGDNEWTDCHRPNSGRYDPIERLARVRELFFRDPTHSLGRTPLLVAPQSADPRYAKFIENARWERAGVVFATVHIPGSNNNLQRDQASVNEYIERNAANLAWIDATFARAKEAGARGIVLAFQAHLRFDKEPPETDLRSGFNDTLNALKRNAIAWGKPVLLIHGDQHRLVIDQPLIGPGGQRIMNVTRLMVHGEDEVHATLIGIDTDDPDLFTFKPVYIQENIRPFKPAVKP
ncbi:MAG: hypothetical protein JWN94_466 [Betaproteobacteria bacterium]|nr:hypothetical protein [Betaproteobacteria bacterium]